ncbi:MAG: hypothetical protein HY738_14170, partial [Bacteroidia bacterium]|nr:hypothetical protein [Bacteroidia bacterium]
KKENKIKQIIFNNIYLNRFLLHLNPSIITIIEKCNLAKHKLRDVAEIWRGLTTGNDNKYLSETKISKSYKKIVQGKQIKRFFIENNELYVNYLENELDRPRPRYIFEQKEKIISKFIGKRLEFAYDTNQLFVINTCVVIFLRNTNLYNTKYLLGILNSRLINFYFFNLFTDYRDIFPIIKSGHLEEIPIKEINLKKPAEKSSYDKLVKLVDEMLELNKNPEKNKIKTAATDSEIDSLVYKLYNISKAEQKIIENKI